MLVGMTEHACTMPSAVRGAEDATPRTSDDIVVIAVAEVMLGTAAASSAARPRSALRLWWARRCDARAERRRTARRRPDYFENAAMAREMYRL
ncbi:Uncharacterised protein [Mycolicibacterium aurum]|uniref:Uncharacterized protein n=2 Tax=Mycolicibacterium aurum TaxID=1791 RepID=A0A3S4U0L0_MYCAU|nr:Uncharacterised protein [Mycolicibacterium aurum]